MKLAKSLLLGTAATTGAFAVANQIVQTRETSNGVTGRLRVERTF